MSPIPKEIGTRLMHCSEFRCSARYLPATKYLPTEIDDLLCIPAPIAKGLVAPLDGNIYHAALRYSRKPERYAKF